MRHGNDLQRFPIPAALRGSVSDDELKAWLSELVSSEESIGATYCEEEEVMLLPNGEQMGNCTNCAWWVVETVGEGDVYGFAVESNPVGNKELQEWVGGHDFAVIAGRYIVDPWLGVYGGGIDPGRIFDLHDQNDQAVIRHHFGDPRCWEWYHPEMRTQVSPGTEEYPHHKRLSLAGDVSREWASNPAQAAMPAKGQGMRNLD